MSRLMVGKVWARFKGNHFPAVAVRDLAIQPRENDLVLATHGRGIWIIDDITPLRALTLSLSRRRSPSFRRDLYNSGSSETADGPNGDAAFVGVTRQTLLSSLYHQRSRSFIWGA